MSLSFINIFEARKYILVISIKIHKYHYKNILRLVGRCPILLSVHFSFTVRVFMVRV